MSAATGPDIFMRARLLREIAAAERKGFDLEQCQIMRAVLVPFGGLLEDYRLAGADADDLLRVTELAAAAILSHLFVIAPPVDMPLREALRLTCDQVEARMIRGFARAGRFGPKGTA